MASPVPLKSNAVSLKGRDGTSLILTLITPGASVSAFVDVVTTCAAPRPPPPRPSKPPVVVEAPSSRSARGRGRGRGAAAARGAGAGRGRRRYRRGPSRWCARRLPAPPPEEDDDDDGAAFLDARDGCLLRQEALWNNEDIQKRVIGLSVAASPRGRLREAVVGIPFRGRPMTEDSETSNAETMISLSCRRHW